MPVLGMRYDKVIHASNSVSIIGCLTRRTAIIVHDFISVNQRNTAFAARYIRATQRILSAFGRDVIYVSRSTERVGRRSRLFRKSRTFYFPNAFYRFLEKRTEPFMERGEQILLCSGWGKNKDLEGALDLYSRSELYKHRSLQILGLAGRNAIVDEFRGRSSIPQEQIEVLPEMSDADVIKAYQSASWVWVHSRKEGYGRSIAEARFCGGAVVATSISPFREQRDEFTFLYSDLEEFKNAVVECERASHLASARQPHEHDLLKAEIGRFVFGTS
ncbi:MAG: glycosyltransferase [Acidobacteria bacterium]|nr:glycosyltransferase [Acidobacteriota bacterium]